MIVSVHGGDLKNFSTRSDTHRLQSFRQIGKGLRASTSPGRRIRASAPFTRQRWHLPESPGQVRSDICVKLHRFSRTSPTTQDLQNSCSSVPFEVWDLKTTSAITPQKWHFFCVFPHMRRISAPRTIGKSRSVILLSESQPVQTRSSPICGLDSVICMNPSQIKQFSPIFMVLPPQLRHPSRRKITKETIPRSVIAVAPSRGRGGGGS